MFTSTLGTLGLMSTWGGTAAGTGAAAFGGTGSADLGSYPEDSSLNPSSSSVIGSSSAPSPEPLPDPSGISSVD